MATVNTCYTSAGCNRCPFSADWGKNGLICYGYSKAVAIYQPEGSSTGGGIISTCVEHTDRVNCVTWINNHHSDETEFLSGSVDSTAKLWTFNKEKAECEVVCSLQGHEGGVTCVSACYISPADSSSEDEVETLVVTASIDSTVRIWIRHGRVPILACGGDDHKVHLYAKGLDEKYERLIVLPGHEDWIRDLHFTSNDNGDLLLASCAQDHMIRVWKFVQKSSSSNHSTQVRSVADLNIDEDIAVKETIFSMNANGHELKFAVSLESVLCGHENWVYTVRWQPVQVKETGVVHQPTKLLSASMDKTMILWSPEADSGMWVEEIRVGDVGGNTLGFFGGLFSPCGQSILAHGYQGAFNQWTLNKNSGIWEPQVTGGGHFDSVVDLAWAADDGDFLLTASVDQTTRLHAPWVRDTHKPCWYEIARPQVHGYDLQCLAALGKYSFASGADEKLVRVFRAPRNFISNFCQICGHSIDKELESEACKSLPEGANVPALGLSNKAVYNDGGGGDTVEETGKPGQYPENYFTAVDLKAPPTEDQLLQNTLWPEIGKLYGHGYEIFSLAAHPRGSLLASACKAAKADSANILLWDMESKKIIASLSGCTLTVTQMAFNHSGSRLLAVSRDRTWAVFKQSDTGQYVLEASVDKKTSSHSRIIWSCDWSHDDRYFFTASRDKKVLVWSADSLSDTSEKGPPLPVASLSLPDSVTAVTLAPVFVSKDSYLVGVGLDNGLVQLHSWSCDKGSCETLKTLATLGQREAHHLTVTRLAFRPQLGRVGYKDDGQNWLQLASSGADHAVRVYDIDLTSL